MKKFLSYIFGSAFLLLGITGLSQSDNQSHILGIIFIFVSLIIYPIFDKICLKLNNEFSTNRKIFLGLTTFMLPLIIISPENVTNKDVFSGIIILLFIWFMFFIANTKKMEQKGLYKKYDAYKKELEEEKKEKEKTLINKFSDLDVFTKHAIATMLSDNLEKFNNAFFNQEIKMDLSKMILEFCKDTKDYKNIFELNDLFNSNYYKDKINRYLSHITKDIKRQSPESYVGIINTLCENMSTYKSVKYCCSVTSEKEEAEQYKNYSLDDINLYNKNIYIYIIDALTTCTCIAEMIFIEDKIKNMDHKCEFYTVVSNMAKEIDDLSMISEKIRPIYNEFYKSNLGFIDGDILYNIAITIMANRVKRKPLDKKDAAILNITETKINDMNSLNILLNEWLNEISKEHRYLEIERYIIYKITHSIDIYNFDLFIDAMTKVKDYKELYMEYVAHNNKVNDKERYLKGDFEKEKQQMHEQYSMNNIATGTQFELYLVNLFKNLGYKTKHNGAAGDQGADLILKKDDYVYVVQAKFYTGKLDNTPVQEITGALKYYNANQGVVITNSEFTNGARALAKANNVILIDGKDLKKLIDYIFMDNYEEDVLKNFIK